MQAKCFIIPIFLFYLFTGLDPVQCKKYDLEYEAMKLYGEDLNTVVKRFRRTPEYLAILKDKVDNLIRDISDMFSQVTYAYKNKMEQKITEDFADENKNEKNSSASPARRNYNPDSDMEVDINEQTTRSTALSAIEKLDDAVPGRAVLTVSEKNHYKDLGFEYAGNAVHAMIANMGVMEEKYQANGKSTAQQASKTTTVSTTSHPTVHKVTKEGDTPADETTKAGASTASPKPATDGTLRYRGGQNNTADKPK